MLTVAEETLRQIGNARGKQVSTYLYGQEINGETYAICKVDLLLKGDGEALFEPPGSVREELEQLV
jgi:type I restriction enzyme M protein